MEALRTRQLDYRRSSIDFKDAAFDSGVFLLSLTSQDNNHFRLSPFEVFLSREKIVVYDYGLL